MTNALVEVPDLWIREVSPTDYSLFREPGKWLELVRLLELPMTALNRDRRYYQRILAEHGNLYVMMDDRCRIYCAAFFTSDGELPAVKLHRFQVVDAAPKELLTGFFRKIVKRYYSDRFFVNALAHHEKETVLWLKQTIESLQQEMRYQPASLFEGFVKSIEQWEDPLSRPATPEGFVQRLLSQLFRTLST